MKNAELPFDRELYDEKLQQVQADKEADRVLQEQSVVSRSKQAEKDKLKVDAIKKQNNERPLTNE